MTNLYYQILLKVYLAYKVLSSSTNKEERGKGQFTRKIRNFGHVKYENSLAKWSCGTRSPYGSGRAWSYVHTVWNHNREFPSDRNRNREYFIQLIQRRYLIHFDKFCLINVPKHLLCVIIINLKLM